MENQSQNGKFVSLFQNNGFWVLVKELKPFQRTALDLDHSTSRSNGICEANSKLQLMN